ncbi:cytochrome P450 6B7 [Manduca sexta]|uniref:cytochrome P450 6B7 n=2 Tax=Manduca sexta TaxID=7130 RepID=UPI00188E2B56|nr:cytochrome P450 6B7 [Manduca sexta]
MFFQVLLFSCMLLIITLFIKKKNYWKIRGVVQETGIIWRYIFGDRSLSEYSKEIYDKYKEDQIGMYFGYTPALMVKNLEDIQAVVAVDFQSFYKRGIVLNENDILGDNILSIDNYPRWKILRHKMTPVFKNIRLKTMFYSIDICAQNLVDLIEKDTQVREKPYNIIYTYTAASIGAAVFGIDTTSKSTIDSPFVKMAWDAFEPSFSTNIKFLLNNMLPSLFNILPIKLFGDHEEFFIGAVKNVLKKRRNSKKRNDFIDVCLELQKNGLMKDPTTGYELEPTDELLAAQAFFFFIAGTETTANGIHFTLLELAANQTILTKLHEDIDEVFKDGKTELTYEDLDNLPYLDMVMNEALRKYPPIGQNQRFCTKNTELPSNKLKIEKGTVIIIPIYSIHRDEKLFPNPDLFDPERFAPDRIKHMEKFSYMAFGRGNRVCIGMRFARIQIKACLVRLLRRYTLAEHSYKPDRFERSTFSIRDSNARYEFIPREL